MDTLTRKERSARMALVHSSNTKPEIRVRRLLHSLGYRFRIGPEAIPGRPDIAFISRKKAIFVHGCFWHRHPGCPRTRVPKSRTQFWLSKFDYNERRDEEVKKLLCEDGWVVMVVWECESERLDDLEPRLVRFLGGENAVN